MITLTNISPTNIQAIDFKDALDALPWWRRHYPDLEGLYFCKLNSSGFRFQFHSTAPDTDGPKEMLDCAYNINTGLGMQLHALLISEGLIDEPRD